MPFISTLSSSSARGFGLQARGSVGTPPLTIGQAYGGGFYAGQISTAGNGVADYNLVVAPLSSGQSTLAWKNANTATAGADSVIDGPQLEICYYNLKPGTTLNVTTSGINSNAVPARASNYTTGTPAQTSAADFQTTGAEDFETNSYWASTEGSATAGWFQSFNDGGQYNFYNKSNPLRVRAVRRVAV